MSAIATFFLIAIGNALFFRMRLLRYLRFFQQEEYQIVRFCKWLWKNRAWDRKGTAIAFITGMLCWLTPFSFFCSVLGSLLLGIVSLWEEDPRSQGKLRLKMTARAKRIYFSASAIAFIAIALALVTAYDNPYDAWFGLVICMQLTPFYLLCANMLLQVGENRSQKGYVKEAQERLKNLAPFVIGITGSYGKTSTKEALGQILQITLAPTFWPPKGINTVMGNTREIRTSLKKGFRFAVMEMGAYGKGSISRLCSLTPPHAAIITAIGTAHLERFGSYENILEAKSELAQAVPYDGILVCNGDDAGARQIAQQYHKKHTYLYGFDVSCGQPDCWISSHQITERGTQFTLEWKGKKYTGATPLFGKPALSNAMAAFTMACALGSDPEYALAVIRILEPVDNRLQVQRDGAVTYLKDAYNSNPIGFSAALDVMKGMPAQRRIVMTPGIIELGPEQYQENEKVGHHMALASDFVIVVGKTNREAIVSGLQKGGFNPEQYFVCDSRDAAFNSLHQMKKDGDVILIENDLPDLYEAKISF